MAMKSWRRPAGIEGLKLFLSHSVDAVVLDYQMPGMNGDVVAAKMKRAKSYVPIMLLSAYGPLPKSKLETVDTFLSKSQTANDSPVHTAGSAGQAAPAVLRPLARYLEKSQ